MKVIVWSVSIWFLFISGCAAQQTDTLVAVPSFPPKTTKQLFRYCSLVASATKYGTQQSIFNTVLALTASGVLVPTIYQLSWFFGLGTSLSVTGLIWSYYACHGLRDEQLKYLAREGKYKELLWQFNLADVESKGALLCNALRSDDSAITRLVLERGANPDVKMCDNSVPVLSFCISEKKYEHASLLLEAGADSNKLDNYYMTPLDSHLEYLFSLKHLFDQENHMSLKFLCLLLDKRASVLDENIINSLLLKQNRFLTAFILHESPDALPRTQMQSTVPYALQKIFSNKHKIQPPKKARAMLLQQLPISLTAFLRCREITGSKSNIHKPMKKTAKQSKNRHQR